MRNCLLVLVSLGCALGCGDNSKECGPGTVDEGGECIPAGNCGFGTTRDERTGECVPDGNVVCSEGTVFDPLTGRCSIDPSSCRDGTILISNACVDPTLAVAQVPGGDPLATWRRWGTKLSGDAAKRQVYLPKAGTYRIAVADTRTLGEYLSTGTATAAPGGDDGDYYVSLTELGVPSITTLPATTVNDTVDGNLLRFYQPAVGTGITQASLAMPSDLAQASVVVMVNGGLRGFADETSQPARVMTGALATGDTTFVVVDWTFDISSLPSMFTLSVNTQNL